MSEHEEQTRESLTRRPTPAEIVEAAIADGRIIVSDGPAADALHMVLAAARQNAQLHKLLERRDAEIGRLTEVNEIDPLTMTYNRLGFENRLEANMNLVETGNRATDPQAVAVLVVDGDEFKLINDTLGHAAGDEVLWEIGSQLWLSVRAEDTVARLGGDEFAVLLPITRGEGDTVWDDALTVVGEVNERLNTVIDTYNAQVDPQLRISLSTGVAVFQRGDELTPKQVLRNADYAMYIAKQRGKGMTVLYEGAALERNKLQHGLDSIRRSLAKAAFRLARRLSD
jgi:diguanylate cyclase (GGDEF)-like protein